MRTALVTLLQVLLVTTSACAGPTGTTSPTGPADQRVPTGSEEVALAVTVVSAWPNLVVADAPTPPRVLIAGDGSFRATVWVDDAEEWQALSGQLPADVLADLLADAAALPTDDGAYGEPGLDGSATLVHLGRGSGLADPREINVWVPEADGYTGEARRHREQLLDLLDDVDDAVRAVGEPWEPTAYLLLSSEKEPAPGDEVRPWPLALDPAGQVVEQGDADGLRCRRVDAAQVAEVLPQVDDALTAPPAWSSGGRTYGVLLLPVLADERCDEVEPYRWPL
jgi:hypothetical protein